MTTFSQNFVWILKFNFKRYYQNDMKNMYFFSCVNPFVLSLERRIVLAYKTFHFSWYLDQYQKNYLDTKPKILNNLHQDKLIRCFNFQCILKLDLKNCSTWKPITNCFVYQKYRHLKPVFMMIRTTIHPSFNHQKLGFKYSLYFYTNQNQNSLNTYSKAKKSHRPKSLNVKS